MDAVKYQKTIARLCLKAKCSDCPIWLARKDKSRGCKFFLIDYPEEAVTIIEKWAEEHPQKTMLQDVLEKYPNAPLDVDIPKFCPSHLGYEKYKPDFCKSSECRKCWNRPLEE